MQRSSRAEAPLRDPVPEDPPVIHLRAGGTSVVVDTGHRLPVILWWGADLGPVAPEVLHGMAVAARPQRVSGGLDETARLTLLPQESSGWLATPGLVGSRGGRDASSRLTTTATSLLHVDGGAVLTVDAEDRDARLSLRIALTLDRHGLLHQRLALTNTDSGPGDPYELIELAASLPIPATATEVLDTTGRHLRERAPQRHLLTTGRYERESRRGRPGADATLLLAAGRPGFAFETGSGTVHAVHLAWSGGYRLGVEKTVSGPAFLRAGELLAPGEVRLAPGDTYTTPDVIASWGDGLTELSARFHRLLRARPHHPSRPRPVTLNTWEAVYFDHDLTRLVALADAGARVGVERFVLDDGWFRGRRDDTSALGDWYVDDEIWPLGLSPLIDHVTALGMEFGLWVEPEMVSPDSDLARRHPEWILGTGSRQPPVGRQQQVLDLSNPAAYAYILERLDALLTEYDISYLKWDHNRDLAEASSRRIGRPAVHENVAALYRLLADLKRRHVGLEIEGCAAGGARVDLGILEHTDRIWTSDCIDPVERLTTQRYTGLIVPPELMGAHLGGPRSHSTGRSHDLPLRAGVALFGHFGVEWDISRLDEAELVEVGRWIDAHKRFRALLHTGQVIHADLADGTADLRGVVAQDLSHALFAFTQVQTSAGYPPAPVTFPGLDPARRYRVALVEPTGQLDGPGQSPLAWTLEPMDLTGQVLATSGLRAPVLMPEQLILIEVTEIAPASLIDGEWMSAEVVVATD